MVTQGGPPPRFFANTDSKGDETRILCNARIPGHLGGRFFCVLAVHLLIPKNLRPELLRCGARLIEAGTPSKELAGRRSEESASCQRPKKSRFLWPVPAPRNDIAAPGA